MVDRNIAMEIATALGKADAQALGALALDLLVSLSKAEATIAEMQSVRESKRRYDRDYQHNRRTTRTRSSESDESSPFSPTPPFSPPTSSPSSSARVPVWHPADEAMLAVRLPSPQGKTALAAVLARCGDKRSVAAEIGMILDGGRPNVSMKPEHMELALSDYAANGLSDGRFNAAHFRRHVQRAAEPQRTGNVRRGGTGQRSADNAWQAIKDLPEAG